MHNLKKKKPNSLMVHWANSGSSYSVWKGSRKTLTPNSNTYICFFSFRQISLHEEESLTKFQSEIPRSLNQRLVSVYCLRHAAWAHNLYLKEIWICMWLHVFSSGWNSCTFTLLSLWNINHILILMSYLGTTTTIENVINAWHNLLSLQMIQVWLSVYG